MFFTHKLVGLGPSLVWAKFRWGQVGLGQVVADSKMKKKMCAFGKNSKNVWFEVCSFWWWKDINTIQAVASQYPLLIYHFAIRGKKLMLQTTHFSSLTECNFVLPHGPQ